MVKTWALFTFIFFITPAYSQLAGTSGGDPVGGDDIPSKLEVMLFCSDLKDDLLATIKKFCTLEDGKKVCERNNFIEYVNIFKLKLMTEAINKSKFGTSPETDPCSCRDKENWLKIHRITTSPKHSICKEVKEMEILFLPSDTQRDIDFIINHL